MSYYNENLRYYLSSQSDGLFRARLVDHPINAHLSSSIPQILNSEPNLLQTGKMYLSSNGQVEEYSGKLNQELQFRQWTSHRKTTEA